MTPSTSLKLSLSLLAVVPLFAACTAGSAEDAGGVSEAEANAAGVAAGSFKLYDQPGATPTPFCDVHTTLTLGAGKANVAEALSGACEIYVAPNPREYALTAAGTSCGSRIWTGKAQRGIELYSITITDNRTRVCDDLIPALIVVEETIETPDTGPLTTRKYSYDRGPAAPADGCRYDGRTLALGEQVPSTDGCNTCTCTEHGVMCTELFCPPAEECRVGGKTYRVGESFPDPDSCNTCTCREGGFASCTELFCPRN